MYQQYFRLAGMPFSIAPDPRFLYRSARHREALAHLLYGVQGEGGIVLLTGEVGTGKTTLCRCLLEEIEGECDVALILNPKMSVEDLLHAICEEFHIPPCGSGQSPRMLVNALNAYLLEANGRDRRAVLIIDEAQNLSPDVLEQLRLLTNLETNTRKLLQIILIGQPELKAMLARRELRQVAQRVVARYHLGHLTPAEVAAYVSHRMRVCGAMARLFPDHVLSLLARMTGGVPRLINLVCDRALLGAFLQGKLVVTPPILRRAAREVFGEEKKSRWAYVARPAAIAAGALSLGIAAAFASGQLPGAAALPPWAAPSSWAAALPATLSGFLGAALPTSALPSASAALPVLPEPLPQPAPPASPPSPLAGAAAAPFAIAGTAAATTPAQSQEDGLTWPAGIGRSESAFLAFAALYGLHGVAYQARQGDPCKAAAGFRCLAGRGGLADLRAFDQPAVLWLESDGRGPGYHVLLRRLEPHAATVIVNGESRRVPLASIAPLWSGSYVLLWRAPPGFQESLAVGSRGPAVVWLRQALSRLLGGSASGADYFDEELGRRLKEFQLAEGMVPDGIAGPLSVMRLSMRLDPKLPRLRPDPAAS